MISALSDPYLVTSGRGIDGKPVGRGAGSSKKRAQQEAARDTLELLQQAYSTIQHRKG